MTLTDGRAEAVSAESEAVTAEAGAVLAESEAVMVDATGAAGPNLAAVMAIMAPKTRKAPRISTAPICSPKKARERSAVTGIKPALTTLQTKPAVPAPQRSSSAHAHTKHNRKSVVKAPVKVAAVTDSTWRQEEEEEEEEEERENEDKEEEEPEEQEGQPLRVTTKRVTIEAQGT